MKIPLERISYDELLKLSIEQRTQLFVKDKEIERLKERLDIAQTAYLALDKKINKAIAYIEENCSEHGNEESIWFYRTINADNVLDILKGSDSDGKN